MSLRCPCESEMRLSNKYGVEIDHCHVRGVWLDRGGWKKVQYAESI